MTPFDWSLDAFEQIAGNDGIPHHVALRTVGMAALVTVTDVALAFPIAQRMARIAQPPRARACWWSRS